MNLDDITYEITYSEIIEEYDKLTGKITNIKDFAKEGKE